MKIFSIHKMRSLYLFLVSVAWLLGCSPDGANNVKTSIYTEVRVPIQQEGGLSKSNSPIPSVVKSIRISVSTPDCNGSSLGIQTKDVSPTDTEVIFSFNLPSDQAACFLAEAFSQGQGNGTILYKGTTSGVSLSIPVGPNPLTVEIKLGLVGTTSPNVASFSATEVKDISAIFNGEVSPNGFETVAYFEWGKDTTYGGITLVTPMGAGVSPMPINIVVKGLAPNTTYHYRLVGNNSGNQVYGKDIEFKTLPPAALNINIGFELPNLPMVSTEPATNIAQYSAQLNGKVTPNGTKTVVYFEYGTTTAYGSSTLLQEIGAGNTELSVLATTTHLSGSAYHYRVVAVNAAGMTVGTDTVFELDTITPLPGPIPTPNPSLPTVTLVAESFDIAESGATNIRAALSAPSSKEIVITLITTGTAETFFDFMLPSSVIVIPAGQASASVALIALDDLLDEFNETVVIDIRCDANCTEATPQQQTVTLLDDDVQPTVTLSLATPNANEGMTTTVSATLGSVSGKEITVMLGTSGTATNGMDYILPTTIVIPAGSVSGSVTLSAVNDSIADPNETVVIDIATTTNAAESGTQQKTVTIN